MLGRAGPPPSSSSSSSSNTRNTTAGEKKRTNRGGGGRKNTQRKRERERERERERNSRNESESRRVSTFSALNYVEKPAGVWVCVVGWIDGGRFSDSPSGHLRELPGAPSNVGRAAGRYPPLFGRLLMAGADAPFHRRRPNGPTRCRRRRKNRRRAGRTSRTRREDGGASARRDVRLETASASVWRSCHRLRSPADYLVDRVGRRPLVRRPDRVSARAMAPFRRRRRRRRRRHHRRRHLF